jgi:hypothetical protein
MPSYLGKNYGAYLRMLGSIPQQNSLVRLPVARPLMLASPLTIPAPDLETVPRITEALQDTHRGKYFFFFEWIEREASLLQIYLIASRKKHGKAGRKQKGKRPRSSPFHDRQNPHQNIATVTICVSTPFLPTFPCFFLDAIK